MSARAQRAPWMICPHCKGEGKLDTLGAVSRADFDEDDWEFYIEGGYDDACGGCRGTGKVREDEQPIVRHGSVGQRVFYQDADDASEHLLRMSEGWA